MAQHPSYDYIVVGAGSAGAVVASRLSEDPSTSVLLLEAGPDNDALEIAMPAAFANLFKTRWDWDYTTTPQPGLGGQRAYWPRMKALGGCSSMNAMMYVRGARADFDGWQRDFGAVGWSYADVLPYFKRTETRIGEGEDEGEAGEPQVEELPEEDQVEILSHLEDERAADVLEEMSPDDAADLIAELPPETATALLDLMEPEEAEDVRRLMSYVEDTAVSPEQLPAYVRRFEEIVARHGTESAYYGHASTGCLQSEPKPFVLGVLGQLH